MDNALTQLNIMTNNLKLRGTLTDQLHQQLKDDHQLTMELFAKSIFFVFKVCDKFENIFNLSILDNTFNLDEVKVKVNYGLEKWNYELYIFGKWHHFCCQTFDDLKEWIYYDFTQGDLLYYVDVNLIKKHLKNNEDDEYVDDMINTRDDRLKDLVDVSLLMNDLIEREGYTHVLLLNGYYEDGDENYFFGKED